MPEETEGSVLRPSDDASHVRAIKCAGLKSPHCNSPQMLYVDMADVFITIGEVDIRYDQSSAPPP
jgi:hypothetical protein